MEMLGYTGGQKPSSSRIIDLPSAPLAEAKGGKYDKYGKPAAAIDTF